MFYHVTYKLIDSITDTSNFNLVGITADSMVEAKANVEGIIKSISTSFNYDTIEIVEIKEERNVWYHYSITGITIVVSAYGVYLLYRGYVLLDQDEKTTVAIVGTLILVCLFAISYINMNPYLFVAR